MSEKKQREKKDIDSLKRELLKLGVWTAPFIISLQIPTAEAQTATAPPLPCAPNLAPPVKRKDRLFEKIRRMRERSRRRRRLKILEEDRNEEE